MSVHDDDVRLPAVLLPVLLGGSLLGLAGGYWDDAFHTEHGRDEFLAAPHLAIYGGVSLSGGALALWLLLAARAEGLQALRSHAPLTLAALSVAVTLASGPIDNAWHVAFGRDAVIWSPPHTLGIVGMAGLACALLLELGQHEARWARAARTLAGAFLLAAFSFVVVEYETDVPQFDALWYLPVLTLVSALALALVKAVEWSQWAATRVALAHLAFVGAVSLFLLALGYDPPKLPLLVAPALLVDVLLRRWVAPAAAGAAFATGLFAVYWPSLDLLGDGMRLDPEDVALGLPLAVALAAAAFSLVLGRTAYRRSPALAAATVAVLLLVLPAQALAHDPGQGDDAGEVGLVVRGEGRELALEVALPPGECAEFRGGTVAARRAGKTVRAPLERRGCPTFAGALRVPEEGRWFVYAELERDGDPVEAWLPYKVDDGGGQVSDRSRYAYFPPETEDGALKTAAGALMYLVMVAFIAAMIALVRRSARSAPGGGPSSYAM